jgi:hypothetical protein
VRAIRANRTYVCPVEHGLRLFLEMQGSHFTESVGRQVPNGE